jgi:hypothetical protein
MTIRRAEHLTGYEIRVAAASGLFRQYSAFDVAVCVVAVRDIDERRGLRRLAKAVLAIHSRIVLARFRWRCAHCGRSRPLEIHHKLPRSLGGTHRVENLEPACWDCHRALHRVRR